MSQLTQTWKTKLTEIIQKDIDDFLTIMKLVPSKSTTIENGALTFINNYLCPSVSLVSQKVFRGPKQFPFIALLPAEVWSEILIDEVWCFMFVYLSFLLHYLLAYRC